MKFLNHPLGKVFIFVALATIFQNCTTPQKAIVPSSPTPSVKLAEGQTKTTTEKKTEYERWQQRAEYTMDVDFNHTKHQYSGTQTLVYYNNSTDELSKAFYHLFMNAFQPGSSMDVRSRLISDPDPRVTDRISKLKPDEIGFLKIKSLKMNGKACSFETVGTILEVTLPEKIAPLSKVVFECEFDGQVPKQIRRNRTARKRPLSITVLWCVVILLCSWLAVNELAARLVQKPKQPHPSDALFATNAPIYIFNIEVRGPALEALSLRC